MNTFFTIEIISEKCISCGVVFGLEAEYKRNLKQFHNEYYCPNGHKQYYAGESHKDRAERMEKQMIIERAEKWKQERLKGVAQRKIKSMKKRSHAGVCICCNRTFKNLAKHMKTKHKEG